MFLTIGGSKVGGHEACAPPVGPISFIFMEFSGKIWPNNRLVPPLGLTPLRLGNPGFATADHAQKV